MTDIREKFDVKTIIIFILAIVVILFMVFGSGGDDKTANELKALHESNVALKKQNDSILQANKIIDIQIGLIQAKLDSVDIEIAETEIDIIRIKKKQNETVTKVNGLDANGVANAFSKYLDKAKPSTNGH